MRVLLVGNGGREHALAWKLSQSTELTQLYVAPGNPGTASLAENVMIAVDDIDGLCHFAEKQSIDLVVVGPELPLTLGLADSLQKLGIKVFGPGAAGAKLEGSKSFAKEIMLAAGVPTARHQSFENITDAQQYLKSRKAPIVIKADGLAAGKGVFVCAEISQAERALTEIFEDFSAARVVIEDFLNGVEASLIVATDGTRVVPMASSHDYKRIFENDLGPNTGGMGTVSPTPRLSDALQENAIANVIQPVLVELKKRGIEFCGFLYAGLMIDQHQNINVLEFNVRFGDPETQSILRRMDFDLLPVLLALSSGGSIDQAIHWPEDSAICVVLAAKGYPALPEKGALISGIDKAETLDGVQVFHAGTSLNQNGELIVSGGRVLNVTARALTAEKARALAYQAVQCISFDGMQYRQDIGK